MLKFIFGFLDSFERALAASRAANSGNLDVAKRIMQECA